MKEIFNKFVVVVLCLIAVTVVAGILPDASRYSRGELKVYADSGDETQTDTDSGEKHNDAGKAFQTAIMYIVTLGCLGIVIEWIVSSIVKAHKNRKNQFSRE